MKRIILVTGGSKGIGASICRAFAEGGDSVVINYSRSNEAAEGLKSELSQTEGNIVLEQADISEFSD